MDNFNELDLRNTFIKNIQSIFNANLNRLKSSVEVFSNNEQETTYPCCLVSILNPITAERYMSYGKSNFTDFTLNCELYSKNLKNYNSNDAIILLSQILINGLLEKYPTFVVTRNNNAPFRDLISRRVISFRGTYDDLKNFIYSI